MAAVIAMLGNDMTRLSEYARWEDDVYQIKRDDEVSGGRDGIANIQPLQLANRTSYLRQEVDVTQSMVMAEMRVYDSKEQAQTAIEAGTEKRRYFPVKGAGMAWAERFENINGVATPTGERMPNMAYVEDIEKRIPKVDAQLAGRIPLIAINDEVVLWLVDGRLESLFLGDNLISSLGPRTLVINEDFNLADNGRISLIQVGDEVVAWLEDGRFCTMDLQLEGPDALSPQTTKTFLPTYSSGASLYRWKAKCAVLENGGNVTAKIAFTGDSWTDFSTIPQQFANALYTKYGKSSDGWASVAGNNAQRKMYMNGMGLTRSAGWVNWGIGNPETTPPPFGGGPDGYCMHTNLSTCSATLSGAEGTQIDIYHRDSGTFRYRVDGGTWNVVATNETPAMVKTTITGLSDGKHTLDIDTLGNTSEVAIYAFRPHSPGKKGVEVLKVGHAGARGLHYMYQVSPYIQPYAADLDPDVVVIILGTNDYRNANSNTANYIDGIASIIDAYQAAHADVGIILVAPADTDGYQASAPLTEFVAAARKFAVQAGVEFIDLHTMMPKWSVGRTLGMWEDSLHMSAGGAQFLFNIVKDKLL